MEILKFLGGDNSVHFRHAEKIKVAIKGREGGWSILHAIISAVVKQYVPEPSVSESNMFSQVNKSPQEF